MADEAVQTNDPEGQLRRHGVECVGVDDLGVWCNACHADDATHISSFAKLMSLSGAELVQRTSVLTSACGGTGGETEVEEATMAGAVDDAKGRIKEAAGAVKDDSDLKREGKADRVAGSLKDKVERAKDWVDDKIDDARDSRNDRA